MEPVFYNDEDSYKAVRLNGILAMFTSTRIERDSLPEGIYAYDVRESDDGNQLSTIEPSVCVNHGGTILTFQEIPMPSKGYVDIEDCNFSPDESLSFEELREEFQKPSLGILPQGANLLKELENAVCKGYDNELCPDCDGPLIYEIDDAPVGKGLIEQYRCPVCDYDCSSGTHDQLAHDFASQAYKQVCKDVCDKFKVNYYTVKNSPFGEYENEITDTIIERIAKNHE